MAWKHGKYYVKSKRQGRRVVSEYIGAGPAAVLEYRLDQIEQERQQQARADQRRQLARFKRQTAPPKELDQYSAAVRGIVADVLQSLGFHRHRRQWRRQRMSTDLQIARDEAKALYFKKKTTPAELESFKQLLDQHTALPHLFGDMARAARMMLLTTFKEHATMHAAVAKRAEQLSSDLGSGEATQLERLLIDEIVLCWIDYYRIESTYAQHTGDTFKLADMDQWEHLLASKQRRYLRAIEALARVRQLLKLPAVQVNIAQPGSQQLNVAGEVRV
jgi:hypothetical protein